MCGRPATQEPIAFFKCDWTGFDLKMLMLWFYGDKAKTADDLSGNCIVDLVDFAILADSWLDNLHSHCCIVLVRHSRLKLILFSGR